MMKFAAACVALYVVTITSTTALASTKPALCDAATGKWDPYHVNCDFECENEGWELKCKCDNKDSSCTEIECRVDRDGAPDAEDIFFYCASLGDGQSPSCQLDPLMDSTLAGSCVKNTIGSVLDAWVIGVSD